MAKIGGDSLIVRGEQRSDSSWLFTIRYCVEFDRGELGMRFDDSVQISACCGAAPVPFVACGRSVLRKKRIVVEDSTLTYLDAQDAVYATVCLRRRDGEDSVLRSTRLRRMPAESVCFADPISARISCATR